MTYIKQLDGIRAIAVLLVIIAHWFPETHWLNMYTSVFNGVDIFFCLSGFLITRILLENSAAAVRSGTSSIAVAGNFFVRRFLRIFPIYYLTLLFLFIAGNYTGTQIRSNLSYFLTYTSNFYFFRIQAWDGMLSHLWSLSVEEQFYLIWPWLILFVNRKYVLPLILLSVAIGIAAQFYYLAVPFGGILTPCCFDGFGIGALLAWVSTDKPALLKRMNRLFLFLSVISFTLQVVFVASKGNFFVVPSRTLTSVCTVWVITSILLQKEKKSVFNTVLGNRALLFIGKISYGLYLYHLIIPIFSNKIFSYVNVFLSEGMHAYDFYISIVENFCFLLAVAYFSWTLIEQPVLKLKGRFQYQKVSSDASRA